MKQVTENESVFDQYEDGIDNSDYLKTAIPIVTGAGKFVFDTPLGAKGHWFYYKMLDGIDNSDYLKTAIPIVTGAEEFVFDTPLGAKGTGFTTGSCKWCCYWCSTIWGVKENVWRSK